MNWYNKKDITHNIVKKLSRQRKKIITMDKIKQRVHQLAWEAYSDMLVYKILYDLKNSNHLMTIRKQLFLPLWPHTDPDTILDELYRDIVRQHANDHNDKRYIWGIKALEICLLNESPSDSIDIINNNLQRQDKLYQDKTISFKQYTHKGQNLFSLFYRHTEKARLWSYIFRHACLEIALLESLYNTPPLQEKYARELVKKALKKYKKKIDYSIISSILDHNKHHSSINRLSHIAKTLDPTIASQCLTLIKKHSFFMST